MCFSFLCNDTLLSVVLLSRTSKKAERQRAMGTRVRAGRKSSVRREGSAPSSRSTSLSNASVRSLNLHLNRSTPSCSPTEKRVWSTASSHHLLPNFALSQIRSPACNVPCIRARELYHSVHLTTPFLPRLHPTQHVPSPLPSSPRNHFNPTSPSSSHGRGRRSSLAGDQRDSRRQVHRLGVGRQFVLRDWDVLHHHQEGMRSPSLTRTSFS